MEIPAEFKDQAAEYREKMIEGLAEVDDHLMEKYLSGEKATSDGDQGRTCGRARSP